MKIIEYKECHRDDLIFMILQAKDDLGRKPGLNEDLLDIQKNYLEKNVKFWLIVNEDNRVLASLGLLWNGREAHLHRFFVKASYQRQGLGGMLFQYAEKYMRAKGVKSCSIHLGTPLNDWIASYHFYRKNGFVTVGNHGMVKYYE